MNLPAQQSPTQFKDFIASQGSPVVVDLWAPWCAPCRRISPVLDQLSEEFSGRVALLKVNADENPEVLRSLGVFSIPTVMLYEAGQVTKRLTGAQPAPVYRQLFESAAGGEPASQVRPALGWLDRALRLLTGFALIFISMQVADFGLLILLGSVVAFSAVYDRCPIWQAVSGAVRKAVSRSET